MREKGHVHRREMNEWMIKTIFRHRPMDLFHRTCVYIWTLWRSKGLRVRPGGHVMHYLCSPPASIHNSFLSKWVLICSIIPCMYPLFAKKQILYRRFLNVARNKFYNVPCGRRAMKVFCYSSSICTSHFIVLSIMLVLHATTRSRTR
jgi:hypothetical protein